MPNMTDEHHLCSILQANAWFMQILKTVRTCNLPDWYVGAGVIRNIVWDHLHHYTAPTPVRDVDVVFFDPDDRRPERDAEVQATLQAQVPSVPWEVTNQAAVHLWYEAVFGVPVLPLTSSADGVGTWPETATSIAVRLGDADGLQIVAPCGLHDLIGLVMRRNPRRVTVDQFRQRLYTKRIIEKWPLVQVVED